MFDADSWNRTPFETDGREDHLLVVAIVEDKRCRYDEHRQAVINEFRVVMADLDSDDDEPEEFLVTDPDLTHWLEVGMRPVVGRLRTYTRPDGAPGSFLGQCDPDDGPRVGDWMAEHYLYVLAEAPCNDSSMPRLPAHP